jgi:hypothetical protein
MRSKMLVIPLAVFIWAAPSTAAIRAVHFDARVEPGSWGSIDFVVKPAARCTITVVYPETTTTMESVSARHTWRWWVNRKRKPGRYPVRVDCHGHGKLALLMTVRR